MAREGIEETLAPRISCPHITKWLFRPCKRQQLLGAASRGSAPIAIASLSYY